MNFTPPTHTLYRRCSGPCGRVLMFDPTDRRPSITARCSVCDQPVNWTITTEPRKGGKGLPRQQSAPVLAPTLSH